MGYFSKVLADLKATSAFLYTGINEEALAEKVNTLFLSKGYKAKFQNDKFTTYEKGNYNILVLAGALYEYFLFNVAVSKIDENSCLITIIRATSGRAGGIKGMTQVQNEFEKIKTLLLTF